MPRVPTREFWCPVVSEAVVIRLRRLTGLRGQPGYFVQCNQVDCQYVEENKPPCPMNVARCADEIAAIEVGRAVPLRNGG